MPSQIDTIFSLGDDQSASQYEVIFPLGIPYELLDSKHLTYRIDQSFDIPMPSVSEQELWWYGKKVTRPTGAEEIDQHITFSFRIDSDWAIFNALQRWKDKIHNPNLLTTGNVPISPNINSIKTSIIISMKRSSVDNMTTDAIQSTFGTRQNNPNGTVSVEEITEQTAMDIILTGVYPNKIELGSFDPSTHDPMRVKGTFTFSDIYFNSSFSNILGEFSKVTNPFK